MDRRFSVNPGTDGGQLVSSAMALQSIDRASSGTCALAVALGGAQLYLLSQVEPNRAVSRRRSHTAVTIGDYNS